MLYFRRRQLLRSDRPAPGRGFYHRRRWRLAGLPQDRGHSGPDFPNILRVPVEKDDTDTMLAVKTGLERGETEFHIYGGMGGRRTDHTVANFQALLYLARRGARGWLYGQGERYTAISGDSITFPARDRGILSVFCLGADAQDVSILGGQYPLHHAVLTADFPLGVSNHFAGQPITVSVRDGSLLIGVVDE